MGSKHKKFRKIVAAGKPNPSTNTTRAQSGSSIFSSKKSDASVESDSGTSTGFEPFAAPTEKQIADLKEALDAFFETGKKHYHVMIEVVDLDKEPPEATKLGKQLDQHLKDVLRLSEGGRYLNMDLLKQYPPWFSEEVRDLVS